MSLAPVGAKNISPVHPWCGGAWRARDHTVRAMAHQSRTDGRKIFRPYTCGAGLQWAGTTIWGAAIVDTQAMAYGWHTHGRKIFRPYTCGARLHWAGVTIWGAAMFDGWAIADGWRTGGRKIFRPYIGGFINWDGRRLCDGEWMAHRRAKKISPVHMRRGGDVLRSGVNGARAGGLKCAAQAEVDFGNRIGYSGTTYMK